MLRTLQQRRPLADSCGAADIDRLFDAQPTIPHSLGWGNRLAGSRMFQPRVLALGEPMEPIQKSGTIVQVAVGLMRRPTKFSVPQSWFNDECPDDETGENDNR